MTWIDGHLDLAYLAVLGADLTVLAADPDERCISLPALRDAGVDLCFATIFTELGAPDSPCGYRDAHDLDGAERAGRRQLDLYHDLERRGEVSIVRTRDDLDRGAVPRLVVLMEGADPIRTDAAVADWADAGVRIVGLTWALGSRYAGGNAAPGPLTGAGRDLIRALDEASIAHDLSHLSTGATDEVLAAARGPVIASHSNARAVTGENERHLTDAHIRAIGRRDGVIGLNLYGRFLRADGVATIADVVAHANHMASVLGRRDAIGLGSDFDGGFPPTVLPDGLRAPADLEHLAAALADAGWSDGDVAGFRGGTWRRWLERVLPGEAIS
ncbi:MAG: membrane dipeptidase [Phycisphaerales bacterium]|nr:membrane dipeptidase [Phycisphaerales bacterium]